jgi:hypothetical protein
MTLCRFLSSTVIAPNEVNFLIKTTVLKTKMRMQDVELSSAIYFKYLASNEVNLLVKTTKLKMRMQDVELFLTICFEYLESKIVLSSCCWNYVFSDTNHNVFS